ncbi:MAG: GNAT family N-acetyltransferase [Chloroflexota bacterium]
MTITYTTDMSGVDFEVLRQVLIDDDFHNGRTAEQYRLSAENSHTCVIAYDGARIVGNARMFSDGVCNAYIVDVWTHSSYRRRGIATEMMRILERQAQGQHICLWTDDAQPFYERIGYRRSRDTLYEKVVGQWLRNKE